ETNGSLKVIILRFTVIFVCISICFALSVSFQIQEARSFLPAQTRDLSPSISDGTISRHQPIDPFQEWVVNSTETRENETIVADRIAISRNISLVLVNCTIMINSTASNTGNIYSYGILELRNSTIRALNPAFPYYFYLSSESTFKATDSLIRDVGRDVWVVRERGVRLGSKLAILRRTNITNCVDGLIIDTKNPVWLDSCYIANNNGVGIFVNTQNGNLTVENCVIEGNGAGLFVRPGFLEPESGSSYFALQYCNFSSNILFGLALREAENATIYRNRFINHNIGIYVQISADNNKIEQNEIISNYNGTGIIIEFGSSDNLIQNNTIRSGDIGINVTSSPNSIIYNQILETREMAILVEGCNKGGYISSNQLIISSGVAMKVLDSSFLRVENNTILSETDAPVIQLEETANCSFTSNYISTEGQAFSLIDSSNNFFSENTVSETDKSFLLANAESKNITFTLFDLTLNGTSLILGSSLKLIPKATLTAEIASLTLYVNDQIFAASNSSNFELTLDTTDIGGGDIIVIANVIFLNGSAANWTFSLKIQGRPLGPTKESSEAKWALLAPLILAMLLMKMGLLKSRRRQLND
ncbi:MAG: right-handed parallel beta-helix repeat-containing protein, partial [Candidatus Hodarchaeota archaeon]